MLLAEFISETTSLYHNFLNFSPNAGCIVSLFL